jgi:hypothetical protein
VIEQTMSLLQMDGEDTKLRQRHGKHFEDNDEV